MTIHNAIKYGTDLLRSYSRAIGLAEDEEGAVRLGETITPVINVWDRAEWAFLRGETLWAVMLTVTGVAAEQAMAGIVNPTGSRLIVVVEAAGVRLSVAGAAFCNILTQTTIETKQDTTGAGQVRDRRISTSTRIRTTLGSAAGALVSSSASMEDIRHNDGSEAHTNLICLPVVLQPGFGFIVEANTNATSLGVNYRGRVRPALPGEL